MEGQAILALAALLWVGVHVGIAGTRLRDALVARLGAGRFRALFSVVSIAAIWFLVASYNAAGTLPLWYAPPWLRWLLVLLMLPALVLFAASLRGNPTAVGGEATLARGPQGVQRITRHPMLWSFAIWAVVHMLGNGDTASLLFFGAFLITALAGMHSIDAKLARRDPEGWRAFAAQSSVIPFAAIASDRTRMPGLREIGWVAPLAGLVLWAALLHLHRGLFGVMPLPPG